MENLSDEILEYNYDDSNEKLKEAAEHITNLKKGQDFRRFLILCKLSAFQCNSKAQYILGLLYLYGVQALEDYFETKIEPNINIELNHKEAIEWFEKSADLGLEYSQYELGYYYYSGKYEPVDYEKALKYFKMCQTRSACFYIGNIYRDGLGVEVDLDLAERWFIEAARLGSSAAEVNLGLLYENSKLYEKDVKKARYYYKKAGDSGYSVGYFYLALSYFHDTDLENNYEKSLKYFAKGADGGDLKSLVNLGYMHEFGFGCEVDYTFARECYEEATEKGCSSGISNLGELYKRGLGVELDYEKAMELYELARIVAEETNEPEDIGLALNNIGELYAEGLGVEKDLNKALELFKEALTYGFDSQDNIDKITSKK